MNFIFIIYSVLFASICNAQSLTNVKTALFRTNEWTTNVNYLSANSSDFAHTYIIKSECETVVKFQEVFCMGKSVNVTVTNVFDDLDVRNLSIKSNESFDCSSNIQNANVAALNSRYSKGEIRLPSGTYSIAMKLENQDQVLGFRGYAVKAQLPLDRLIVASQCRSRFNPNKLRKEE